MEHPSSLIPAVWYNYSSYNDLLNRSRQLQQQQPVAQTTHAPSMTSMTSMTQMMVPQPTRSPVPDVSLQMSEGRQGSLLQMSEDRQNQLLQMSEGRQNQLLQMSEGRQSSLLQMSEGRQSSLLQMSEGRQNQLLQMSEGRQSSLQMAEGLPKPKKIRRRVNYDGKPRTFQCMQCPSAFHTQAMLNSHNRIHSGIKPYVCDVCGKAFIQRSNLKAHKRIHTGERPYSCDECGKSFRASSYLVVHKRIHSGEKPYICGYCGKGFCMSTYLANHIRKHTGEQPFKCEFCDERFSQSLDCRMHRMTHTGEKPIFKCRECNITFVKPKEYRNHKKEFHPNSKPFKCQICDKGFSNPTVVERHESKCKGHKRRKVKGRPRKHPKKEFDEDRPKRAYKKKDKKPPPVTDRISRSRTKALREPDEIKEEPETEFAGEMSGQQNEGIDINELVKELGIEGFTKEALEEIPTEVIQTIPREYITQELLKDLLAKREQQRNNSIDNSSLSVQQVNGSVKAPMVTIHQQESVQSSQQMLSPNHQAYTQHQQVMPDQQAFVHQQTLQPQVITSNQQMITMQQNLPDMSGHQHIMEPAEQLAYERHHPYAVDLSNITNPHYSRT